MTLLTVALSRAAQPLIPVASVSFGKTGLPSGTLGLLAAQGSIGRTLRTLLGRHVPRWIVLIALVLCSAASAADWDIAQDIDPNKVVGHKACAECHQSEIAAWEKSAHATQSWSLLEKGEAQKIAERLDVGDATSDQRCTTCHGTQQKGDNLKAVSCESCHGAAGGESGWLEVHNFFGADLDPKDRTSREKETEEDYHKRLADCDRLGMRRSDNLYALAKNCIECHTVPNETLVNEGQHPTETKAFEVVEFSQGEVRHNFQLNQAENAAAPTLWTDARFATDDRSAAGRRSLMYVVGQLAACEVSLRSRATATGRGKFLTATNKRILDIKGNLEDIHEEAAIKEVQEVLDALEPLKRSLLRKVTDQDPTTYGNLAELVAQAGQQVASSYSGNDWGDVKVPKKTKGKAYQP